MFSFLSPILFLGGFAAAVAIPLILHMIQSSKTVRMPFSTIRFLKIAQKKSSRRVKMENMLLWLLRFLLMVFLALAFGVPMVRTSNFGSFIGRTPRNVAIVIDASYSMGYTVGKESVWDRALDAAVAVCEGLNEGDQICLFVADEDVKPVVEQLTEEKEYVIAQIRALEKGYTISRLAPAVLAANSALEEDKRNREKEIHIITDNQALPWESFGKQGSGAEEEEGEEASQASSENSAGVNEAVSVTGWDAKRIQAKTTIFVTLLGATSPENVAPADVDISPKLIMADMASKIRVRLMHCGPPKSSSVTVFLNGEELQKRSMLVGGDAAAEAVFNLPPLEAGSHIATIELPEDNLLVDNKFNFLFKVKEYLPVLCVGYNRELFFMVKAMTASAGGKSGINVKVIDPAQLASENLAEYSCVFLCNALPISGNEIMKVETYTRSGGLLVIFPGDRASVSDYEPWTCLPAKPKAVRDILLAKRKHMLRWEQPQHPLLRELRVGESGAPLIAIKRILQFNESVKDSGVLISAGADKPFIMDREFALGHVLLFSVSADRTWSDLPLSPYFLPFLHQVVQYGAGMGGFVPYVWATHNLPLHEFLPEATRDTVIRDPDDKEVSIRTSLVQNRTILHAEEVMTPGIYTIQQPGAPEAVPALAVNIPRNESNLTPVNVEALREITGLDRILVATNHDDMLKQIEDHRMGKTLAETCLWLVLIIAAVEFFYANMKTKEPSKLTDVLGIETTGEVTG